MNVLLLKKEDRILKQKLQPQKCYNQLLIKHEWLCYSDYKYTTITHTHTHTPYREKKRKRNPAALFCEWHFWLRHKIFIVRSCMYSKTAIIKPKRQKWRCTLDFSARWMMQRGSTDDKTPLRFKDRVWARWFYEIWVWIKQSFYITALLHKMWLKLCTCN